MSAFMTLRINGDATKLEALAAKDAKVFLAVAERAKQHGLISHHFYAAHNEILVVDEWPSENAFHTFFKASPEIAGFMKEAGVTAEPVVTFWRKLDLGDDVG